MSTQERILALLLQTNHPISGQQIADQLGISRTAVWKVIEQLREQGYEITSHHKMGYHLTSISKGLNNTQIRLNLDGSWKDLHIELFDQVTSTNDVAKRFAIEHPKQAALFVATEQTQGRGRSGRPFHSHLSNGLYLSLVFQPMVQSIQEVPQFTLVAASAMVKALEELTDLSFKIKWVNDLFLNGRKIGGILTEATTDIETQSISSLIVGIGLNLAGDFDEAPDNAKQVAGTIFGKTLPADFNRNQLLNRFLHHMQIFIAEINQKSYLPYYEKHILGIGRHVHYIQNGWQHEGVIEGINEEGHLLVRDLGGTLHTLFSQEVHFSSQQFTETE